MTEPKYQPTDDELRIQVYDAAPRMGGSWCLELVCDSYMASQSEAEAEAQRVALAIADRVHGAELAALRAEVASLKEIAERLGGDVLLGPIEVAHEELRGAGLDPARVGEDGAELAALRAEVERLRTAMRAIDDVRNSIIGHQTVNWSAHVYPLVAALQAAGYPGAGYDEARADAVRSVAEAERERCDALNWRAVAEHVTRCDGVADTAEDVIGLLRTLTASIVSRETSTDRDLGVCDECGGDADGPGDAHRVNCDCGDVVCSACCVAHGGESYCPTCAAAKRVEAAR